MNRPDVVTTVWKDGEVWRNDRNGIPRLIRPADPELVKEFQLLTTPPAAPEAQPKQPALDLDFA